MEAKKYPRADLGRYRDLIFSFSMVVTMLMVITAFEWRSYERGVIDMQGKTVNSFEELTEIPPTEIPPPPPPVVTQALFVEIPDEEEIIEEVKINLDVEMNEETRTEQITIQPAMPVIEKEDSDEVFTIVEQPATPVGGYEAFYKDIAERLKYPAQARRMDVEGRVFVEFVVNRDGTITDLVLVKGIGAGCDEEALSVLRDSPPWKPGKQRGVPVRQKMVIPIVFKLGKAL